MNRMKRFRYNFKLQQDSHYMPLDCNSQSSLVFPAWEDRSSIGTWGLGVGAGQKP